MTCEIRDATPSLAAIVLNYNYEGFVGGAIESLLAQTEPFDEIVIVDDGSTDASLEVIGRYAQAVKIIAQPNAGQMAATLAGLRAMRSDFVYVLDADDFAAPDLVRRIKPALRTRPAKLQFQLHSVGEGGERLGASFPQFPAQYGRREMIADVESAGLYLCPPTSGNVYARSLLEQLELEAAPPRAPLDAIGTLAAPYVGEVLTLHEPLASYRVHATSFSGWARPDRRVLTEEIELLRTHWAHVVAALGPRAPRVSLDRSLYVAERTLMIAALDRAGARPRDVAAFVWRLRRAHRPTLQKLFLAGWAVALLTPHAGWRRSLVWGRRSPVNRPRALRALARVLKGGRRTRSSPEPAACP